MSLSFVNPSSKEPAASESYCKKPTDNSRTKGGKHDSFPKLVQSIPSENQHSQKCSGLKLVASRETNDTDLDQEDDLPVATLPVNFADNPQPKLLGFVKAKTTSKHASMGVVGDQNATSNCIKSVSIGSRSKEVHMHTFADYSMWAHQSAGQEKEPHEDPKPEQDQTCKSRKRLVDSAIKNLRLINNEDTSGRSKDKSKPFIISQHNIKTSSPSKQTKEKSNNAFHSLISHKSKDKDSNRD